MTNGKSITIHSILERIFRTSAYTKHLNFTDAVELAGEAIDLLGVPTALIEKVTDGNKELEHPEPIIIEGYKGDLPFGLKQIMQTRTFDSKIPMYYSGDTFHMGLHCQGSPDLSCHSNLKYKIQKNKIHTSFEKGIVEMAFYSYYLDDFGMPVLPDSESYAKAIETYIVANLYNPLWELGLIPDKVMQKVEQKNAFYMGQAVTDAHLLSIDQTTSLKNIIIQLIPDIHQAENYFKNLGEENGRFNNSDPRV